MNNDLHDQYAIGFVIRDRCLEVARQAYEEAALGGLCEKGRIEMVLDAIGTLDVKELISQKNK